MRHLYIIKTGSTFPAIRQQHHDFEDWISRGLLSGTDRTALPMSVLDAKHLPSSHYPLPADCAGVVVSGSHDMVTDNAAWIAALQDWLLQVCCAQVPVLGICFGHQLLAQALGGKVSAHPQGLELGTVTVQLWDEANTRQDPLWQAVPGQFEAQVVHYQSVQRLPAQAQVLAGNAHEPHHAFRWGQHVWGVQFHPEFSAAAMQAYIDHLVPEHMPPLRCQPTPDASQLLPRFGKYCQQWSSQQPQP